MYLSDQEVHVDKMTETSGKCELLLRRTPLRPTLAASKIGTSLGGVRIYTHDVGQRQFESLHAHKQHNEDAPKSLTNHFCRHQRGGRHHIYRNRSETRIPLTAR